MISCCDIFSPKDETGESNWWGNHHKGVPSFQKRVSATAWVSLDCAEPLPRPRQLDPQGREGWVRVSSEEHWKPSTSVPLLSASQHIPLNKLVWLNNLLPSFFKKSSQSYLVPFQSIVITWWILKEDGISSPKSKLSHWALHMCLCAKSLQLCPTLCGPMHCHLPDHSVHGILQAKILEWVAMPSSRGSSRPRDRTCISFISCIGGRFFTTSTTREAQIQSGFM